MLTPCTDRKDLFQPADDDHAVRDRRRGHDDLADRISTIAPRWETAPCDEAATASLAAALNIDRGGEMRTLQLLTLSALLSGAATSSIAPARAVAQTRPAASTSSKGSSSDLRELLVTFADAWNRHDVDALMSMMAPDGVFEASGGNTVNGERYEGQQAVKAAYAAIFTTYPDARWNNARHFVVGDRGVSEWTFTGTMKDGKRVEVTGCDLFTFRNGRIALKNSYRKNRPPLG
jgi:taurine dehydrogenase small subunit